MSFSQNLSQAPIADSYVETLLAGDRQAALQIIEDCSNCGVEPVEILTKLVWPVMETIQTLYKEDRISQLGLNLATRLNRMIADRLSSQLTQAPRNGKRVLVACGDAEPEELGGQICADLFEAHGWDVKFAGGGIANDEVLALVGEWRPNLLVMFATRPQGVPAVRKLIDYLRDVNSNPDMQVMCCGGIYKRAEGLAEEIGADLFAPDAADAVRIASDSPLKKASADQQTVGRNRRIRKAAEVRRGVDTQAA